MTPFRFSALITVVLSGWTLFACQAATAPAPSALWIHVDGEAVYGVTFEALVEAGLDSDPLPSDALRLTHRGQAVPLWVEDGGSGAFGPGAHFEFLGERLAGESSTFDEDAPTNVYRLTWEGGGRWMERTPPPTERAEQGMPSSELGRSRHLEEDQLLIRLGNDIEADERPELWYWAKLTHADRKPFVLPLDLGDLDSRTGGEIELRLAFRGLSLPHERSAGTADHRVEVSFDGRPVGEIEWSGRLPRSQAFRVPAGDLAAGRHKLELRVPARTPAGADTPVVDVVMFNWLEVSYPRLPLLGNEQVEVGLPAARPSAVQVISVGARSLVAYGRGGGRSEALALPLELDGTGRARQRYLFRPAAAEGSYFLVPDGRLVAPTAIELDRPSNLRDTTRQADYLILGHRRLLAAIEPLAEFHRGRGLSVAVVDVADVYDEFNDGILSPRALRDFVAYAYQNWQGPRPRFVLLVGDASWDVKNAVPDDANYANWSDRNLVGRGERFKSKRSEAYPEGSELAHRNLVPSWNFPTYQGHAASDNYFVDVEGEDLQPELAIGRLPVTEPEEVRAVVEKTIRYVSAPPVGPWRRRILWVSNEQVHLQRRSDRLARRAGRLGYGAVTVYPAAEEPSTVADQATLATAIEEGQLLVHFVGHGGRNIWRTGPTDLDKNRDLFTLDHLDALPKSDRLPVVLSMTCFSAPFDHPFADSIGEKFLRLADRGAVAVIAASWRNEPTEPLSEAMVEEMLAGGTLGEAFVRAKRRLNEPDLLATYNLLGDPALPLALPSARLALTPVAGEEGKVWVEMPSAGFTGRLIVEWLDRRGDLLLSEERPMEAARIALTPPEPLPMARAVRAYAWNEALGVDAVGFVDLPEPLLDAAEQARVKEKQAAEGVVKGEARPGADGPDVDDAKADEAGAGGGESTSPPPLTRVPPPLRSPSVRGLSAAGPAREEPPAEAPSAGRPAGTLAMIERLAAVRAELARADPRQVAFGSERLIDFYQQLEPPAEVGDRLQLAVHLAWAQLTAGRTAEALATMAEVRRRMVALTGAPSRDFELGAMRFEAIAGLRLGEQANCLHHHGVDSCLLPIRGGGVHHDPSGAASAVRLYRQILEREPDSLTDRWLLNLAAMAAGEYPAAVPERWLVPEAVFASDSDPGRFYDVAPGAGVAVAELAGGAALEDFDGDGRLDLMASSWGPGDPLRYFQSDGDGTFTERSAEAGLEGLTGGLNLVHADYDNDGRVDVLVLRGAWLGRWGRRPNSLLRNRGPGADGIARFEDVTEEAGLLESWPTQTAAWGDYDGDGWIDLFVGNESSGPELSPCRLYRNLGPGAGGRVAFEEVSGRVGADVTGFVKAAVWGDVDNDGRPDLYLSRFGEPNQLLHNDGPDGEGPDGAGGWRFTDLTAFAGVAEPLASFPAWFFDYDNNGWTDLFVAGFPDDFVAASPAAIAADYLGLPHDGALPRLYRNRGSGAGGWLGFEDVTAGSGLERPLLAMGANFGDLDNDGRLDLYLGTGAPDFRALVPNLMFRNASADGRVRFEDVTTAGGFGHLQKGHGVAWGDVDNDGDQDVYSVLGGAYGGDVYPNALFANPGHGHRWITLRLEGIEANRSAIGARLRLDVEGAEGERSIHATVGTGGSFGSSSLQQEIGLGQAWRIRRLEIRWPGSGAVDELFDLPLDRVLAIREGTGRAVVSPAPAFDLPPPMPAQHRPTERIAPGGAVEVAALEVATLEADGPEVDGPGADDPAAGGEGRPLARWRGGELTRADFLARYDPEGVKLARGGTDLRNALSKAVFQEIYRPRAIALGLEADPEVEAEMADWRRRALAQLYRQRFAPSAAALSELEVRAHYRRRLAEEFSSAGSADLEVLFVRCDPAAEGCRARVEEAARRLTAGAAVAEMAAEEQESSGGANGTFEQVPLTRLSPELRAAAVNTPEGEVSPPVVTALGTFWVRVLRLTAPRPLPLEQVEVRARRGLAKERLESWLNAEREPLRQRLGLPPETDEEALLAAAGVAAGLDRDPELLAQQESTLSWKLADAAFFRHREILPSDAELAATLEAKAAEYRRYSLRLAVVGADGGGYEALALGEEVAEQLRASAEPAALFTRLPELDPRVELVELPELTAKELRRVHTRLADLAAALEPGAWIGPEMLKELRPPAGAPLGGLVFLLLEARRLPSVAEARAALLRGYRGRVGASAENFMELVGRPWELELSLPEDGAAEPEPRSAALRIEG